MTREEHLQWAKKRAIELLDAGEIDEAFSSMCVDIMKNQQLMNDHRETIKLGMQLFMNDHLNSADKMRDWILGFN